LIASMHAQCTPTMTHKKTSMPRTSGLASTESEPAEQPAAMVTWKC
jgi:hypothetical protein